MDGKNYILAVALLTWGGVFAYLIRLELLTRALERQAAELHHKDTKIAEEARSV